MSQPHASIDLEHLFKLRLAIARLGEQDNAQWWNTRSVLGANGAFVFRRGFPTTHRFAQARVAFAVAKHRCADVFDVGGSATLWNLPAVIENQFEDVWQVWLDHPERWQPFFEQIVALRTSDASSALCQLELVTDADLQAMQQIKVVPEARAVEIPMQGSINAATITMLAAGFTHAEAGHLVVPYTPLAV